MFSEIYNILYILGLRTHRYIKRFFLWLFRLIKKPVKVIGTVFFALFLVLDKFLLKTVRLVIDEVKELASDFKRVFKNIIYIIKNEKKKAPKVLSEYFKKAFTRHRIVFSYIINLTLPIMAFILMINIFSDLKSTTLALEIKYNGTLIGCVASESVYLEAEELAKERLNSASVANIQKSNVPAAEYTLKRVKNTEIKDSTIICDRIIEKSDDKITNACGIYIDNEFICAVKNETDAITVFDNILKNYDTGDQNATATFVESVSYVQGLYPDNENAIWDAAQLEEKLKSKKSEARYYEVMTGDTVSGIADKMNTTTAKLKALNPSLTEKIHIGDKILVSSEVNFIRIQVTKTETRTETLKFETEEIKVPNLYVGTKRTLSKGSNGEQQITELVTYIDGVKISAKEVSRVTTREPVSEKIQVGTKSSGYGGSFSGSFGGADSYPVIGGGRFGWPAVGATVISSGFGWRSMGWHSGVDLTRPGGSTGAPVVAAGSGTVVTAQGGGSYGYHVIINHGNGVQTLYAHMIAGSLRVSPGQKVSAGQVIGNIGATGNVTGPHLHFEVRINGKQVNPLPYIR